MLDDIAKVDRVHNPEPVKTHRDRDNSKRNNKDEHSPAPAEESETGENGNDNGPSRLLDIRI
jgi:hypothetical protein